MADTRARLAVVNGLRGCAIAAVVAYHLFSRFVSPGETVVDVAGFALPVSALLGQAWLGVNLFFVLSGFVLALPYADGRRAMSGEGDARSFYARRFRRLMPLYYLNVLVAGVFVYHPPPGSAEFLSDAFFMATATFNFVPDLYYPSYNWVLWSLGLEVWFSLLFPFLLIAIQRVGIGGLTAATLLVSLGVRVIGELHYQGTFNPLLDPIKDSVLGRLDEFVLGILLAHLYVRRRTFGPVVAVLSCLGGIAALWTTCGLWDAVSLGRIPRQVVPFLYDLSSLGLFLLVLGALSLTGPLRHVLTNRPLQLLGMMCYSLYVWHGICILYLFTAPEHYAPLPLALNLLVILALTAVSYRYVEFGGERDVKKLFVPVS